MSLYFVSYDLRSGTEDDYQELYDELSKLGANRLLESTWCVEIRNTSADGLLDHLMQHMSGEDGILVNEIADWAAFNIIGHIPD